MFRGLFGRRVVVNLREGGAFEGQVLTVDRTVVRLRKVAALRPDGNTDLVDGVVRIPLASVIWVQELA